MSGEGPESIPTSADPRSKRPTKKRALKPASAQAAVVGSLFARPDQPIRIPPPGGARDRRPAAPPEIVTNVQGSSAGAGSGEFHVYKASRRREYERLRRMDEEVLIEKETDQFERTRQERERRDAEKTRKNREKREKTKARKAKVRSGAGPGEGDDDQTGTQKGTKGPRLAASRPDDAAEEGADEEMKDASPAPAEVPQGIMIQDD